VAGAAAPDPPRSRPPQFRRRSDRPYFPAIAAQFQRELRDSRRIPALFAAAFRADPDTGRVNSGAIARFHS